jgi:DNA-directed RNA polymerase subunit L
MKDINRAIEVAKHMLELEREKVQLTEDLIISLELRQAWPDIFNDTNGVSFAGYSHQHPHPSSGSIIFNTSDGGTTSRRLDEAPESYLKILNSKGRKHKELFNPANNELFKRKRAAKKEAKQ